MSPMEKPVAHNLEVAIGESARIKRLRITGQEELSTDLKNMVNRPESSDIVLKCNDGIGLHACRCILVNRCTVFKSMLSNGMLETRLSEVQLVKYSSSVMLPILEYLYSGTIKSYPPINWKMGFEIIGAAQFFIIPQVESIVQDFLWSQLSSPDIIPQKATLVEMLNIAVEFQETWEGKDEMLPGMLLKLIGHIDIDWPKENSFYNLSRSALEYILSHSKPSDHQGKHEPSVEEYFRFRKIVLWHVDQAVPVGDVEARTAIQNVLPANPLTLWRKISTDIDAILPDITSSFRVVDSSGSTTVLSSLVGANIYNDSLQELLLRHITLSRMPASLLLKVIYPLQVIPPGQLLKALAHLALHRRVQYSVSKFDWKHGPSLSPSSEGRIFCSLAIGDGSGRGMAVAFIPASKSSDIREWSFELLHEEDGSYIEFGFICQPADHAFEENEMLKQPLRDSSLTPRVLRYDTFQGTAGVSKRETKSLNNDYHYYDTRLEANSVVNFKLNESDRTCQVEFGDSFEAVWKELPDGDYYPSVGFNFCRSVGVQLRLVSGFDCF